MTKQKKPLVVVDADTLVYRAAAVSEERSVLVKHIPSKREKIYKNKTEFKNAMKGKNFVVNTEHFIFEDIQEEQPISNCLHTVKLQAQKIIDRFPEHEIIWCCGDRDNFRLDLPLPVQYKSNRSSMIRPIHLSKAKEYFIQKYKAKSGEGYECDDLSIILAYDGKNKGRDVILLSPDKDSKQAVGLNLFDYTNPDKGGVEINEWHPIELNLKKEFKSYGIPFLAYQLLRGDGSDGWWPYKLAGKEFGDTGAYKLLKDCQTAKECLEVVIKQYQKWYPEPVTYRAWNGKEYTKDWKDILQMYFYCAKMKQSEDDELNTEEFLDTYGVKL